MLEKAQIAQPLGPIFAVIREKYHRLSKHLIFLHLNSKTLNNN